MQWGKPSYKDIKLCVLDTQGMDEEAFAQDLDVVQAFAPFHEGLREFATLRSGKDYFGEYLSQGALNI